MNNQDNLAFLTREELKGVILPNLRGITAYWKNNTAIITFYFNGKINESEQEEASELCTYIISHFPDALLEEKFIRLDYPALLPSNFLVFPLTTAA